jgi:hypothetical protein
MRKKFIRDREFGVILGGKRINSTIDCLFLTGPFIHIRSDGSWRKMFILPLLITPNVTTLDIGAFFCMKEKCQLSEEAKTFSPPFYWHQLKPEDGV